MELVLTSCAYATEHETSAKIHAGPNFPIQFRDFCHIVLLLSVCCVNVPNPFLSCFQARWRGALSSMLRSRLSCFAASYAVAPTCGARKETGQPMQEPAKAFPLCRHRPLRGSGHG